MGERSALQWRTRRVQLPSGTLMFWAFLHYYTFSTEQVGSGCERLLRMFRRHQPGRGGTNPQGILRDRRGPALAYGLAPASESGHPRMAASRPRNALVRGRFPFSLALWL